MTTKDALLLEFRNTKVRAEMMLELIEIEDTMTAGLLESAKEQIHTATEAYIRMAQIQM